ncbi:MAG: chordopoxvirus fusion protein, partial [Nitrospirae bacterium]
MLDRVDPTLKEVLLAILEEIEKQREHQVTKKEFNELKAIVRELAEAQKRTEEELKKLVTEHQRTRQELGGLSHTVGYILEDRAYAGLPPLLEKDFRIKIKEPLKRDWIEVGPERFIEINILGKGRKNGKNIWVVGECKTQLKKKDVEEFLR